MRVNEEVRPNIWTVETANSAEVELCMNREIIANEDGTEPTYIEVTVKQVQTINKKVITITDGVPVETTEAEEVEVEIPVKINCKEAEALAHAILYKILPNCSVWRDLPQE